MMKLKVGNKGTLLHVLQVRQVTIQSDARSACLKKLVVLGKSIKWVVVTICNGYFTQANAFRRNTILTIYNSSLKRGNFEWYNFVIFMINNNLSSFNDFESVDSIQSALEDT
eukprot:m.90742 g.90742  ORF g.90742 m.90742 type:complete len:112 (+) comp8855_c0_seq1:3621-3956(+)